MSKLSLTPDQPPMTDLSVVDEAKGWAGMLESHEHRGPGDTLDAARHRVACKYRLPEQLLWTLRYRKPKRIWADLYKRLELAVAAEIQSQEAKLRHELEITKALPPTAARLALIAETEAVLGSMASAAGGSASEPTGAAYSSTGNIERRHSAGRRSTDEPQPKSKGE